MVRGAANVEAMSGALPQKLRADAEDNRARILGAAQALFAAGDLNVPMRLVAERAGVSSATLYRRFPTKAALAAAVFAEQMRACEAIVAEALADPDPWRGFCLVIEEICELHARNGGFTAAFMSSYPGAVDLAQERRRALRSVAVLADRAKHAGRLRADFVLDDLIIVLMANRGIRAPTAAAQVAAARRFAMLAQHGFRAEALPAA
jgi:AcrR family transcriptional regulator